MPDAIEVIAHRGFSSLHPESTRAAYLAAIDLARTQRARLALECDVHFSADHQLIVLHDLTCRRTGGRPDAAAELTVEQLKKVDFGRWKVAVPTRDQRELLTFDELVELVVDARHAGVDIELAIETKHPNPSGRQVDDAVIEVLRAHDWTGADAPARVISFDPEAVTHVRAALPDLRISFLIEKELGEWADGHLPDGIDTVGIDHRLAANEPDWVARLFERGHRLHLWTVNESDEMAGWIRRGATGITTDHPDRALAVTRSRAPR